MLVVSNTAIFDNFDSSNKKIINELNWINAALTEKLFIIAKDENREGNEMQLSFVEVH